MNLNKKTQYKLSELAESLDVTIKGDPDCIIEGVCTIQNGIEGRITFLMNPLYAKYLPNTSASCVILQQGDASFCATNALICRDPYYVYAKIAQYFGNAAILDQGVHSSAVVDDTAVVHPEARIGANCVIGKATKIGKNAVLGPGCIIGDGVEIGEATALHANVTIYHDVIIGQNCVIASGAIIGSDGFGIAKHKGIWHKVPQLGRVVIGDFVDIGANTCVDRGAIGDTVIENGVKLDNLIQVGHNVKIGENSASAAFSGISGSTEIGKNTLIGARVGIVGHISIADNVVLTAGTGVSNSVKEPGIYSSGMAGLMTNKEWRKNCARINRLAKLYSRVKTLEKEIAKLSEREE